MIRMTTGKLGEGMTYPGGKGGSGVYQKIINLIPPHETYIETHLGGGSVLRHKKPAKLNIGIDLDAEVIEKWQSFFPEATTIFDDVTGYTIKNGDAVHTFINGDAGHWLKDHQYQGSEFIYMDPPYLMETRKGGNLYNFEYSRNDHINLLKLATSLPCMVMISGYYSSLYMSMLQSWNVISFEAQTRQGPATEYLWFNYPVPTVLHDYSYLGEDFRQRERIKKKRDRWVNRLLRTPDLERNAILEALNDCLDPTPLQTAVAADIINNVGAGSRLTL